LQTSCVRLNKRFALVCSGFLLILFTGEHFFQFSRFPSWKIYDLFTQLNQRFTPPPPALREITIVGIDSDTIAQMKERWPYSRSTFAKVIANLRGAGARAVGLDFSFFGNSSPEEDMPLRNTVTDGTRVILGASLKENQGIQFSTLSGLEDPHLAGIVNKLQDSDGVTRNALTYLVETRHGAAERRFFSWEMKLLQAGGGTELDLLEDGGNILILKNSLGETKLPVDPATKTFPIRFRAHTGDFKRLSFHQVFTGEFDGRQVANKTVLIGFLSTLLQDLHRTPLGWLPGITLNANAFLTLYARDFLRPAPMLASQLVTGMGLLLTFLLTFRTARWVFGGLILLEILAFFALSYYLFSLGYQWNYGLFPLGALGIFILSFVCQRR